MASTVECNGDRRCVHIPWSVFALRTELLDILHKITAWLDADIVAGSAKVFQEKLSFIGGNNWLTWNNTFVKTTFVEHRTYDWDLERWISSNHVWIDLHSSAMEEAIARYKIAKSVHLALDAVRVVAYYKAEGQVFHAPVRPVYDKDMRNYCMFHGLPEGDAIVSKEDIKALVEHAKKALVRCPMCLPDIATGVPRADLRGTYEYILGSKMQEYCRAKATK